ncbi:helix-turn-helix domain-containing protein [Acidocella facilis]|jgi:FixJ family two-component response regulator|uniref:helix-turn-helix domain-containing protein n=1 Tax=Acidocella facilis TaxID=525 RepID=UPI001F1D9C4D|nr:winged helix-turn-helix domain-containing protein [Acidocella facilis]
MRQVRKILRLVWAGISNHQIARRTGVVPATVRATLQRVAASGLSWPLGGDVTEMVDSTKAKRLQQQEILGLQSPG